MGSLIVDCRARPTSLGAGPLDAGPLRKRIAMVFADDLDREE
jgi:hypothetical protein